MSIQPLAVLGWFLLLSALASTMWVFFDARVLARYFGQPPGSLSLRRWILWIVILWPIFLPKYLIERHRLLVTEPPAMVVAASGLYPDPTGVSSLRRWDGTRWHEAVAEDGVAGVCLPDDELGAADLGAVSPPMVELSEKERRSSWWVQEPVGIGIMVILVAGTSLFLAYKPPPPKINAAGLEQQIDANWYSHAKVPASFHCPSVIIRAHASFVCSAQLASGTAVTAIVTIQNSEGDLRWIYKAPSQS